MKHDKPAKLINKLLEQTKIDARRIAALEAKLSRALASTQDAIDRAVERTIADHQVQLARSRSEADEVTDRLTSHVNGLEARLAETQRTLSAREDEVKNLCLIKKHLEQQLKTLGDQLTTLQPQLTHLASQRVELTQILDKVRDRMRRKERVEERAILNRQSVVGQTPAPRR